MSITNLLKLLFAPGSFADAEMVDAKRKVVEEDAVYGDLDEFRQQTLGRVGKKRRGLLVSLLFVFATTLSGAIVAEIINLYAPINIFGIRLVRLVAMMLVAWSVLSRLGYETHTFDGTTLLERTNEFMFKFFYLLTLFIAAISLFLEPKGF